MGQKMISMVLLGEADGHPVFYDKDEEMIHCKDQVIPLSSLLAAYTSGKDRYVVRRGLNFKRDSFNNLTIGCLTLSEDQFNKLYNKVKKSRINYAGTKKEKLGV